MNPLVSILIPVYKVEPYIERCLHSVLQQDYSPLEIIVVNDASPDGSIDIARRVIEAEARPGHEVRIITHERNRGLGGARRTAMEAMRGEWVLILDSDDWWDNPHMLSEWLAVALNGGHDVVVGNYSKHFRKKDIPFIIEPEASGRNFAISILSSRQEAYLWNKLFSTSLFAPFIPLFEEGRNLWEDYYVTPRLLYCAQSVGYYSGCTVHYEQSNMGSYTHNMTEANAREMRRIIDSLAHFFIEENGDEAFRAVISRALLNLKLQAYLALPLHRRKVVQELIPEPVEQYLPEMNWRGLTKMKFRLMEQAVTAPLGKALDQAIGTAKRVIYG